MRGNYLLLFVLSESMEFQVGSLGKLRFEPGLYIYTGSAQNGIESRLGRHFSKAKKFHWHIDYLLAEADVLAAIILEDRDMECDLNGMLDQMDGCVAVCKGFGSTGCHCHSHLHSVSDDALPSILNEIRWICGFDAQAND